MTNYEKIKRILEHGHYCAVKIDEQWQTFSSFSLNGDIRESSMEDTIEETLNSHGTVWHSESMINKFNITEFRPIPRPFKILKVGDKVDILENCRELEEFGAWCGEAHELVGKKGLKITNVSNSYNGVYYGIDGIENYAFPHHCVSPHIEEEPTIEFDGKEYTKKDLMDKFDELMKMLKK